MDNIIANIIANNPDIVDTITADAQMLAGNITDLIAAHPNITNTIETDVAAYIANPFVPNITNIEIMAETWSTNHPNITDTIIADVD